MSARIILLNGVGSVGKSSVARALQTIVTDPFLHVAMDTFIDMLPEAMVGHPDGVIFETIQEQGRPSVTIRTGPVMQRLMHGMVRAIDVMARAGIFDVVMLGSDEAQRSRSILSQHTLYFVGLFAPLEVLEARERQRGEDWKVWHDGNLIESIRASSTISKSTPPLPPR
jgi:chloramphenicol 3-O phosphotransferase